MSHYVFYMLSKHVLWCEKACNIKIKLKLEKSSNRQFSQVGKPITRYAEFCLIKKYI